jgi:YbgC/YbaW family acyl-CoA thioester hydrolase
MPFEFSALKSGPARFRHPMQVAFQDIDAVGVVFFARFFVYFHDGYAAFLESRGLPLRAMVEQRTWALPLTRATADFVRPLRLGDRFEVQLVAARPGAGEVELGWRLASADDAKVFAVGQTVHASVDAATFRRIDLPDEVRALFAVLEASI